MSWIHSSQKGLGACQAKRRREEDIIPADRSLEMMIRWSTCTTASYMVYAKVQVYRFFRFSLNTRQIRLGWIEGTNTDDTGSIHKLVAFKVVA